VTTAQQQKALKIIWPILVGLVSAGIGAGITIFKIGYSSAFEVAKLNTLERGFTESKADRAELRKMIESNERVKVVVAEVVAQEVSAAGKENSVAHASITKDIAEIEKKVSVTANDVAWIKATMKAGGASPGNSYSDLAGKFQHQPKGDSQ
jgi:hypothetical protein